MVKACEGNDIATSEPSFWAKLQKSRALYCSGVLACICAYIAFQTAFYLDFMKEGALKGLFVLILPSEVVLTALVFGAARSGWEAWRNPVKEVENSLFLFIIATSVIMAAGHFAGTAIMGAVWTRHTEASLGIFLFDWSLKVLLGH